MKIKNKQFLLLSILAASLAGLVGCNAMNDNPISPQQMVDIRKKEAADRQQMMSNPTPPPAPPKK